MHKCDYCGFASNTLSGAVRHRKNHHNVQKKPQPIQLLHDDISSSSESSESGTTSAVETCFEDNNNGPRFNATEKPDCCQVDPNVNNFYLECQFQQLMSKGVGSLTFGGRDTETNEDTASKLRVASEFGKLVSILGISTRQTDILLDFIQRPDLNLQLLPRTWRTVRSRIHTNFLDHPLEKHAQSDLYGDGEETIAMDISEVNTLAPTVYFVKRKNILTAAMKLLLDKYLCTPGALVFSGNSTTITVDGVERLYGEVHTGDWWIRLCEQYVAPGCHPLVVNLFTDGTRVGRNTSRQPFVLSITNYRGKVQRSVAGKTILGYVPHVKGHEASAGKLAIARARIAREVYRLITKDLVDGNQKCFPLVIHGKIIHFQVFVQNLILDGPEARKATGVLSACQTCHTPRNRFDVDAEELTANERSWRTTASMRQVITDCDELCSRQEHARDGTAPALKELLDVVNVRHVYNPWWDVPFASPHGVYGAVATDRMHMLQGLINNLQTAMDQVIKSECAADDEAAKTAYLNRAHGVIDDRFARIPQLLTQTVYLPRFSTGFYSKSLIEAWHHTAWLSLIPFVLGNEKDVFIKSRAWR